MSLMISATTTCVTVQQSHIHFWSSKLQTGSLNIYPQAPLSTLAAPRSRTRFVECNQAGKNTRQGNNASAYAVEDGRANDLVVMLLACQGTRAAINFSPRGNMFSTSGYNWQEQPWYVLILVEPSGMRKGAGSHEESGDGGNDGELHDEDK